MAYEQTQDVKECDQQEGDGGVIRIRAKWLLKASFNQPRGGCQKQDKNVGREQGE